MSAESKRPSPAGPRIESRARHLLPEELAVGSADPRAQAEAILTESDVREADPEVAPDSSRRTSNQNLAPGEPPEPPVAR